MTQGVVECFGPLSKLKPGKENRFGFRCKKDEAIQMPLKVSRLEMRRKCPPNSGGLYGWCGSRSSDYWALKEFGRFTPGNGSTSTCVRSHVRCNGVCNCGDCSDEEGCDKLPILVG